jgi:hypothetical protein
MRDVPTVALGSNSNSHEMSYDARRRVYPFAIEERVYDLGWRENWRRVLARPWSGLPRVSRFKAFFFFGALVFC